MSGFPGGPGSNGGDLDSLFAQLRQQQSKPINLEPSANYYNNNGYYGQPSQPQPLPHGYEQPSVSSAMPTPPVHNQQPNHSSAIMSPNPEIPQSRNPSAIGGASNADRTSSLLNLLKFSQPSASSSNQPAPIGTPALPVSRDTSASYNAPPDLLRQASASGQTRSGSSQDLLAALMGSVQAKPAQPASIQFSHATQPTSTFSTAAASPPADTQAYLLHLLNQPKPPQSDAAPLLQQSTTVVTPNNGTPQDDVGKLVQALEDASLDMNMMGSAATEGKLENPLRKENASPAKESSPAPKVPQGLFTYVNPFEQLAASSPRNRTPKSGTPVPSTTNTPAIQILKRQGGEVADNKRKIDERSAISSPTHSKRKLEQTSQASSSSPTPLLEEPTPLETSTGFGATGSKESVAEALSEVGDKVAKQVEEALAQAEKEESQAGIEKDMKNMLEAKTEAEFEDAAQIAASSIKKELEKKENSAALDSLPAPVAEAVKGIIDDAAHGHIADSWESADAEDSPGKEESEGLVKVYNFPMKPWITITIKETDEPRPVFRDDIIMDIARLKKEFDQIDRTLVTASNNFIVYGMSKNGGIRIIRQEDGKDSKLFTETHERIFNVATSVSTSDLKETIIGTGINGTVYWAVIKDGEGDYIEDSHPETHGFALPPIQTHDMESPGGVLKTRARKSSSHPEFFAVGRGKSIHIIWPSIIMKQAYLKDGKERIVDTEKYLNHRSLKVNTGKAGKDFTFSEDDTTIVSLDKAGRVKFWDVRTLTKTTADMRFPSPEQVEPIEIKEPLITFTTTPATEKSWPTSVLFVDKLRPYQRGGALRYLIVGMKQNHTLQLWDLALGKPVQEIHLPHGKESDAVCSVLYHAATGMIIVGHPTRNSVYFLHLSAPKYSLPKSLSQAEYMEKLVANDPTVPKPDSTAVISGMREYSFANKGSLRSLDILQNPSSVAGEPVTLFELYAMHSKGVTCLSIKQADLGWTEDNKVISPIVAEKAGAIEISVLKEIPAISSDKEMSQSVSQSPAPTHRIIPRPAPKESAKKVTSDAAPASKAEEKAEKKDLVPLPNGQAAASGTEKPEKKKRRKATQSSSVDTPPAPQTTQSSKSISIETPSAARNGGSSKTTTSPPSELIVPTGYSQNALDGSLKNIETRVSGELKKVFGESLDSLYRNIKDDRRTQAAVSDAKQDAMLRLVSSTLSDNVEQTLNRIVSNSIKQSVLPVITDVTVKAVNEQLGTKLNTSIGTNLPKELQKVLPDAIAKAIQQPQIQKAMADSLAKSVSFRVEETFANLLQKTITPAFSTLAVQTSQRVAADIQRQASEQIGTIERQRHADSIKIEQLTQLVSGLTEMVTTMAAAQSEFQGEFLRMQQSARERTTSQSAGFSQPGTALMAPEKSKEQLEQEEYDSMLESINVAMNDGNYEDAIIRWLQTGREQEFFANFFSKFNPAFIRELSPLMLLSVGATISVELEGSLLMERVAWLEVILSAFTAASGNLDEQVRELVPKIMSIYIQRLEHLFMRISNVAAQDPILKRLSMLVSACNRLLDLCRPGLLPRAPSAASSARGTPHLSTGHRSSMSGRGLGL